jgi:predicted  nucleic acid-binding Zn-ribbon protein
MSKLKTVERARDMKSIKRKMETLSQKNEGLTDELKTVNRGIESISRKLNSASDLKKTDNNSNNLKCAVLDKVKSLNNTREVLIGRRESALNSRIETVSDEIKKLAAVKKATTAKIDDLDKHRDPLMKKRDRLAQEIASGNSDNTAKLEQLNRKIENVSHEIDDLTVKEAETERKLTDLNQLKDSLIEYRSNPSGDVPESSIRFTDDLNNINREIDKVESEIKELTANINNNLDGETLEELTQKHEALLDNRDHLERKIAENKSEYNALKGKLGDFESRGKRFSVNDLAKRGIKTGAALGVSTVKETVKSGFKQIDPLAKGINKNDVADTGMESVRFARQGISKTTKSIKTTQKTVKTTTRSIKTAVRVSKRAVKTAYRATAFAVKSALFVAKLAIKTTMHIIAALFNPVTWIILGILLVVAMISGAVVLLMGGAGGGRATMATGAVGLGDVPTAYLQGVEFRNNAIDTARAEHNALVNAPSSNDLIYMEVTRPDGTIVQYSTGFATPAQKNVLNNAPWTNPLNENLLGVNDAIAIAYVLLQKRANEDNDTVNQIYDVVYTQAIFDEIIGLSVVSNSTVYPNQPCPGQNCQWDVDDWGFYTYCNWNHNLHAVGVWYYNANTVMTSLGFTAHEREWVSLTIQGFESNPQITG